MKKKFFYKLMTAGTSNELMGKKLDKPRRAVYYSKQKYIVANNEEEALQLIRDKHKLNKYDKDHKWTGFKLLGSMNLNKLEEETK